MVRHVPLEVLEAAVRANNPQASERRTTPPRPSRSLPRLSLRRIASCPPGASARPDRGHPRRAPLGRARAQEPPPQSLHQQGHDGRCGAGTAPGLLACAAPHRLALHRPLPLCSRDGDGPHPRACCGSLLRVAMQATRSSFRATWRLPTATSTWRRRRISFSSSWTFSRRTGSRSRARRGCWSSAAPGRWQVGADPRRVAVGVTGAAMRASPRSAELQAAACGVNLQPLWRSEMVEVVRAIRLGDLTLAAVLFLLAGLAAQMGLGAAGAGGGAAGGGGGAGGNAAADGGPAAAPPPQAAPGAVGGQAAAAAAAAAAIGAVPPPAAAR